MAARMSVPVTGVKVSRRAQPKRSRRAGPKCAQLAQLFRRLARHCSISVSPAGIDLLVASGLLRKKEREDFAKIRLALQHVFELQPASLPVPANRKKPR
jgi:hypothetical protein